MATLAGDASRPLDQHDHGDTVISYVIRGSPFLGPGDTDDPIFQNDGTEDDAERLLRLAVAEAERRFELTLAARTPETPPRGHKRGRDATTTNTPPDDDDEDGAARGAARRVVITTPVARALDAGEELEAASPDYAAAAAASRPEHLTTAALADDGWQFADDDDDSDGFLPVGPADDEDDDEQFAFLPMDLAVDDDYMIFCGRRGMAMDEKKQDGQLAPSGEEDFIPLDDPTEDEDDYAVYEDEHRHDLHQVGPTEDDDNTVNEDQCGDVVAALGEKGDQFALETEDFIPLDPAEDDRQFASENEEDFIPLDPAEDDCVPDGQCGGVMLNELALQDQQFASEAEDLLSLDQIDSDDIVYDAGWLDRLIRPVLGP